MNRTFVLAFGFVTDTGPGFCPPLLKTYDSHARFPAKPLIVTIFDDGVVGASKSQSMVMFPADREMSANREFFSFHKSLMSTFALPVTLITGAD
jgi:hypothetical protein